MADSVGPIRREDEETLVAWMLHIHDMTAKDPQLASELVDNLITAMRLHVRERRVSKKLVSSG